MKKLILNFLSNFEAKKEEPSAIIKNFSKFLSETYTPSEQATILKEIRVKTLENLSSLEAKLKLDLEEAQQAQEDIYTMN